MVLGELGVREFLSRHWQKEPLLIRGALRDWRLPAGLPELIALAAEADVTSRLVFAESEERQWSVRRGPIPAKELQDLPERGWTLLVQEIDRRIEGFEELLDRFRFIPNWRIDDVMVSYATDGGGVGPHVDRHDVFLLQAEGRRRWRIESAPRNEERLRPDTALPLLADFDPEREWTLEPGDMLYLPPRVAHEGVALGCGFTCSIGFRTPDPRELCAGFLRQLAPSAFDAIRYSDPDLAPAERRGEIPAAARERLRESARRLFADADRFDLWVGSFVTTPRRNDRPEARGRALAPAELSELLERGGELRRSAASHFAWLRDGAGSVWLFVGGEGYPLGSGGEPLAELLCGTERLDRASLGAFERDSTLAAILSDATLRGFLLPSLQP